MGMMRLTQAEARMALLFGLAYIQDRKVHDRLFTMFRSKTTAPLFVPIDHLMGPGVDQAKINFGVVVAWKIAGHSGREIAEWTGISRQTVQRYLKKWREMSDEEKAKHQREVERGKLRVEATVDQIYDDYVADEGR